MCIEIYWYTNPLPHLLMLMDHSLASSFILSSFFHLDILFCCWCYWWCHVYVVEKNVWWWKGLRNAWVLLNCIWFVSRVIEWFKCSLRCEIVLMICIYMYVCVLLMFCEWVLCGQFFFSLSLCIVPSFICTYLRWLMNWVCVFCWLNEYKISIPCIWLDVYLSIVMFRLFEWVNNVLVYFLSLWFSFSLIFFLSLSLSLIPRLFYLYAN